MGMKVLQNSQNCREGYESLTELTELSGKGMKVVQNSKNCQVRIKAGLNPGKYRGCARIFPGFRGRKTSECMTYTPSGICHTNGPPHEGYHVVIV